MTTDGGTVTVVVAEVEGAGTVAVGAAAPKRILSAMATEPVHGGTEWTQKSHVKVATKWIAALSGAKSGKCKQPPHERLISIALWSNGVEQKDHCLNGKCQSVDLHQTSNVCTACTHRGDCLNVRMWTDDRQTQMVRHDFCMTKIKHEQSVGVVKK